MREGPGRATVDLLLRSLAVARVMVSPKPTRQDARPMQPQRETVVTGPQGEEEGDIP